MLNYIQRCNFPKTSSFNDQTSNKDLKNALKLDRTSSGLFIGAVGGASVAYLIY